MRPKPGLMSCNSNSRSWLNWGQVVYLGHLNHIERHMKHVLLTLTLALAVAGCGPDSTVEETPEATLAAASSEPTAQTLELRASRLALLKELRTASAKKVPTEVTALAKKTQWLAQKGLALQMSNGSTDSLYLENTRLVATQLTELQQQLFPKMRQAYVRQLQRGAAGRGVRVNAQGQEVTFWSAQFADPLKQGKFKVTHEKPLAALRFQKMHFRWGNGPSAVRSFDTFAMQDDQISGRISGQPIN